ncbi:hypothetical protein [Methylocucumis oryzae]|uniref:Uncharacterized protein n=1 Tax=Methylocucumis oryzae TaxID=1632867 RepID=A0A0F3INF6_9GAMM|nr:hypothetical protein [Methylocucumis oryzae]KJV08093.1 hypothetical protein VZ94_00610 [Methylocucumis oryzae]
MNNNCANFFIDLFTTYLADDYFDANVSGVPELGSIALVRRSIDAMGFSMLNEIISDKQARIIHKLFRGRHYQGRGFQLFEAILRVLYRNNYAIEQYWHPKATAISYPANIFTTTENPDTSNAFLTSRIFIRIPVSDTPDVTVLQKLALSLLPARIVAFVAASPPDNMILDAHDATPPPPVVEISPSDADSDFNDTFDLGHA